MRYLKYEFANKAEFEALKKSHLMNKDSLKRGIDVVERGDLEITKAIMSEDGETVITPAVMTGKYAVDILWKTIDPITEVEAFEVYPEPCGKHTISGLTHLYEAEYYTKFPELKPKNDDE